MNKKGKGKIGVILLILLILIILAIATFILIKFGIPQTILPSESVLPSGASGGVSGGVAT